MTLKVGTKIKFLDKDTGKTYTGEVIRPPWFMKQGTVVVVWDTGFTCEYTEDFIKEHYEIVE